MAAMAITISGSMAMATGRQATCKEIHFVAGAARSEVVCRVVGGETNFMSDLDVQTLGAFVVNISVIGTGYVGLVVGACLAETGNYVVCADVDRKKIEGLRHNQLPIYEPGLLPLVERNQQQARLTFTDDVRGRDQFRERDFHSGRHAARRGRIR